MFKTKRKRKAFLIVILILVTALISARLYLPIWLKKYVNEQIAQLDNYGGGVEDIDVFLWRGAYQIEGLNIYKISGGLETPFVAANTVDLSVEWRALIHGAVVAEIDIYKANLNFSKSQTGEGAGWARFVDALSPLDINRLDVHSGKLTYTDYAAEPNVHLYIDGINASVTNLRNIKDVHEPLPSYVNVTGTSIGKGRLDLHGQMNILKDIPDFDLGMELKKASLMAFNNYALDVAGVDFESGNMGVFSEVASSNGKVTGYVKFVADNVSMVDVKTDGDPVSILWQSLVSVFTEIFENQPEDQFAMRVPIEGNLDSPDKDMWRGFLSIFSNAFVSAFSKNEDGIIDFEDILKRN